MTRFAQPGHFHLHCISWKSDFGLIGLICLRRIWEFQPAGVIDWWTGWYEPQHSACPLIICWHAAPSPSWPPPYLTPTETTIVNHNSLQETNSGSKCICSQLFPLFRNNLIFAETKTHLHFTLNILIQTWWLAFRHSLEGRGLLFTSKPCCHKLLVHVQRSRIIDLSVRKSTAPLWTLLFMSEPNVVTSFICPLSVKWDLNDPSKHYKLNILENASTAFVFIIVVVNVFITAFGVQRPPTASWAPSLTASTPSDQDLCCLFVQTDKTKIT